MLATLGAVTALAVLSWAGLWLWSFVFGPGAISPGVDPSALAVSPDGRYLYVAGDGPSGSALSSGGIAVVDTRRGSVVKTIKIGSNPGQIAVPGAGDALYAAPPVYTSDDWVAKVSLPEGSVGNPLKFSKSVDQLFMSPDGKVLYVALSRGASESVVPVYVSNGTVGHAVNLPSEPIALAAGDGEVVYAATGDPGGHDDRVYAVDVLSGAEKVVDVGYYVAGIQASVDGRALWVLGDNDVDGASGPHALVLIGLPEMKVIRRTALGPAPMGLAVDPSGRVVFVSGDDTRVEVIDADTGRVEASLRTGAILANSPGGDTQEASDIVLSPDGAKLYAVSGSGKIAVLSVARYTGH